MDAHNDNDTFGWEPSAKIEDQIDILRSHWPNLNPDPAWRYMREVYPTLQFPPDRVDAPYAIIRPGFFANEYGEEFVEILKALAKDRSNFKHYYAGKCNPKYLCKDEEEYLGIDALAKQQPEGDILVVPAKFNPNWRYHGHRVQAMTMADKSLLGVKDIGTMLIANPKCLRNGRSDGIHCLGDKFNEKGSYSKLGAPHFFNAFDQLILSSTYVGPSAYAIGYF